MGTVFQQARARASNARPQALRTQRHTSMKNVWSQLCHSLGTQNTPANCWQKGFCISDVVTLRRKCGWRNSPTAWHDVAFVAVNYNQFGPGFFPRKIPQEIPAEIPGLNWRNSQGNSRRKSRGNPQPAGCLAGCLPAWQADSGRLALTDWLAGGLAGSG